jgi:8-oxo-dGTP diphosphatase
MTPWREAARAVVLDPADRILLVRFSFGVWAGPGGGLDPGETHVAALRRELAEELGLDDPPIGPCIWLREHELAAMPPYRGQRERLYLVRTAAFEPAPRVDLSAEHVTALRWWTLAELERSDEQFSPRRLPEHLRDLLTRGPPPEPVDVGV